MLHQGTFLAKLKSCTVFALYSSPFAFLLQHFLQWLQLKFTFLMMIAGALVIDHLTGTLVHAFRLCDFSWRKNLNGLLMKMGMTVAGYVLFEMLNAIIKDAPLLTEYLQVVTDLTVFLYPAGSALANISILTHGKFPPVGWMKKLSRFQQNLSLQKTFTDEDRKI